MAPITVDFTHSMWTVPGEIMGSFTGEDSNDDGLISKNASENEVTSFSLTSTVGIPFGSFTQEGDDLASLSYDIATGEILSIQSSDTGLSNSVVRSYTFPDESSDSSATVFTSTLPDNAINVPGNDTQSATSSVGPSESASEEPTAEDTTEPVDPSESGGGLIEEPTAEDTTEPMATMGEDLLVLSAKVAPEGFPGSGWNLVFEDINKDGLLQLEEVTNFSGTALVVPGGNVEPGFYDQLTNVPNIADISTTSSDPGGWSFAQSFDSNTADIFTGAWTYEISPVVVGVPQAEDPIDPIEPTEPEETAEPVFGTDGPDTIEITGSGALVFAGAGNDLVDATGSGGGNRIYGGSDDDDVILNAEDRYFGNEGNDRFFVQTGGGNIMTGGPQADQFWIAVGEIPNVFADGTNIITDFDLEEEDVIGIAGLEGVNSFEDLSLDLISTSEGPNTLISVLNPDGTDQPLAFVQGVELGDASSFVIV